MSNLGIGKGNTPKVKWTDDELDNLYRLAISERRPLQELTNISKKGRTMPSIATKMHKTFMTATRTDADTGLTYLYLQEEVEDIVVRRRKSATINNIEASTSNDNTSQDEIPSKATTSDVGLYIAKSLQRQQALQEQLKQEKYLVSLYLEILTGDDNE
jgi:hypothetical protein